MKKTYPVFGKLSKTHCAVCDGEKRCPRKGEWYLSGAQVAAYQAPNDLKSTYFIARLVRRLDTA